MIGRLGNFSNLQTSKSVLFSLFCSVRNQLICGYACEYHASTQSRYAQLMLFFHNGGGHTFALVRNGVHCVEMGRRLGLHEYFTNIITIATQKHSNAKIFSMSTKNSDLKRTDQLQGGRQLSGAFGAKKGGTSTLVSKRTTTLPPDESVKRKPVSSSPSIPGLLPLPSSPGIGPRGRQAQDNPKFEGHYSLEDSQEFFLPP